jgi:hypothetical protein
MISTYDGRLMCYEGRELSLCNKFANEWVRIGYSEMRIEEEGPEREGNKIL